MKKRYVIILVLILFLIILFVYVTQSKKTDKLQPTTAQSSVPETITEITLPPEPDKKINDATLAGVDSNNNGVRDDMERLIAQKFGGTADYQYILAYAKQYQLRFVTPTPTRRSDALIQVSRELCTVENESDAARRFDMRSLFENTAARKQTNRAFYDVLVSFIPEELPPCATSTAQTN